MTPDPLPVALPELPKPYLSKNYPYMRQGDGPALFTADQMRAFAEAALRAQAEEVAALRALLKDCRELVGLDGYSLVSPDVQQTLHAIDAHLASKQEKPDAQGS